jgi:hypothetical protein
MEAFAWQDAREIGACAAEAAKGCENGVPLVHLPTKIIILVYYVYYTIFHIS